MFIVFSKLEQENLLYPVNNIQEGFRNENKEDRVLTAACAMLSSTAGCQIITIDGEGTAEVGENGVVGNGAIGLAVSTLNNPFFVSLAEGAQAEAEEKGAELITVDAGDDAAKQTNDVEDLISRNVSVLIVNPVDSDAVAPAVKDAISERYQGYFCRPCCEWC